jgi:hypothetical protein
MSRNGIISVIREDDPSYDPIPAALAKSGIQEPVFRFAESYIYADGYYGPFSASDLLDESSAEERGLTPEMLSICDTRDKCLDILSRVAGAIGDYTEMRYEEDEDGNGTEWEEASVDAREIVDDRFAYVREIYGSRVTEF